MWNGQIGDDLVLEFEFACIRWHRASIRVECASWVQICNHKFITDINEIHINYIRIVRADGNTVRSQSVHGISEYIMNKMFHSRKCHLSCAYLSADLAYMWVFFFFLAGSVLHSYWNTISRLKPLNRYRFFFEHHKRTTPHPIVRHSHINLSFGWQTDIDHRTAHYSHLFVFADGGGK